MGYFFTKELEIFLKQDIDVLYTDGGDMGFYSAIGLHYHFDLDAWQPFVGAQLGIFYGDDTVVEDTGAFGPEVGVKYFVNNTTFIYGEVAWIWFFDERESGDEDDSRWTYAVSSERVSPLPPKNAPRGARFFLRNYTGWKPLGRTFCVVARRLCEGPPTLLERAADPPRRGERCEKTPFQLRSLVHRRLRCDLRWDFQMQQTLVGTLAQPVAQT